MRRATGISSHTLGRLWDRYFEVRRRLKIVETSDPACISLQRETDKLRDRLVVNYSPLVKYVAGKMPSSMRKVVEGEDLMSWGVIGLLDAIKSFDPSRETKFESYAISKIRWAMLDELRKQDWVPRRIRLQAQEMEKATARLSQGLRRAPTEIEVASEMDVSLEEYRNFLGQYSRANVSSLEARLEMNDRTSGEFQSIITDLNAVDPQSETDQTELRRQLIEAISELGEQERLVATFYFYEGLTLKEIGKALGLTEGRISQILRRALGKLRQNLAGGSELPNGVESRSYKPTARSNGMRVTG